MCFVKHPARVCRWCDGIKVSACLAGTYLAMTYLAGTCLAGEGTSCKTRSATSAFGGHGWMNAMKKYEVKLKVFQHIHWLAQLCGLLSWTCFVKHQIKRLHILSQRVFVMNVFCKTSRAGLSVMWWNKGVRLSGRDLSGHDLSCRDLSGRGRDILQNTFSHKCLWRPWVNECDEKVWG